MENFNSLGLNPKLLQAIEELGFVTPMPVQEKVIPLILEENCRDLIVLAQTGTGKTAAFALPLIQKTNPKAKKAQHLIIAPTRELCLQIADDIQDFAKFMPEIKIAAIFGGSSMENQIKKIKSGVQIISATPGRLHDLIDRGIIDLSQVETVVLDEADEMLTMGFQEDLEAILETTPEDKNTFLFSATMPSAVLNITNNYMKNSLEITIGKKNSGAENIIHNCYMVHAKERYLALKRVVDFYPEIYGIVFCRTRQETKDIAENLLEDGYNADALHGDLSQVQRESVMTKFRNKHLSILVATDVAARGLDVDNLTHVINYNLPDENELYTHRSGRTGRAGKSGIAVAIVHLKEKGRIKEIEKQINKKFNFLPVPAGKDICEKQIIHLVDRMEKVNVDDSQIEDFLPKIYKKLEWLDREELIKKFVSLEFNRFAEYYKNTEDLIMPEEGKRVKKSSTGAMTRFFINLGNKDYIKPTTIIGMINDYTNIRNIEIGEIEILKNFSFFEADSNYADLILKGFSDKFYKEREINVEVSEKAKSSGGRSSSFGNKERGFGDRGSRSNAERSGRSDRGGRSDSRRRDDRSESRGSSRNDSDRKSNSSRRRY